MTLTENMENNNSNISGHDQAVLTRIFNPNLPYGDTYDEPTQTDSKEGNVTRKIFDTDRN